MSSAPLAVPYAPRRVKPAPRRWQAKMMVLSMLAVLGGIPAALIASAETRPKMIEVVTNAASPMTLTPAAAAHRTLDGITFPDWSRWGWAPAGGRTDGLHHGKVEETMRYVRGTEAVTFSIVSGLDNVDDEKLWPTPFFVVRGASRFELLESRASVHTPLVHGSGTSGTYLTLKRHVRGHTVVLTGVPATQGMRNQLRQLALRDVPAQQREHTLN